MGTARGIFVPRLGGCRGRFRAAWGTATPLGTGLFRLVSKGAFAVVAFVKIGHYKTRSDLGPTGFRRWARRSFSTGEPQRRKVFV